MLQEITTLRSQIETELPAVTSAELLDQFRLRHLVKKGTLTGLMERLREVPKEDKPIVGKALNELRQFVELEFTRLKDSFDSSQAATKLIDVTLPGRREKRGSVHPVQQTLDGILSVFRKMGFSVAEAADLEDDYHNFEALNFAPDHPARDMQDTFFIKDERSDLLLRTHTSSVQIRMMQSQAPPIRSVMPGRVYRNEAVSARSLAEFHQVEGLCIDKNVTFAELKGTIITFAKEMYGANSKFRFRPSYFPFTEPSAEVDISCYLCSGKGCRICKYSGWLEICGCGMVHPNVLKNCNIDPEVYSGYAFGFGIERVTMLRTGIDDIRLLYENDVRVLEQF
ncbi:MAG: phenylalanine--tRNA ligase subunit alpha [Ignavibacteria bacterium]|nr:phenylalanine--tRNA ligase subunit alpha [Ignavibacteria bacterium]